MDSKQMILDHIHAFDHITQERERAMWQKRLAFAKIQIGGFKLDFGGPPINSDAAHSRTETCP